MQETPLPPNAIPAQPYGISRSESEIMVGQYWQKVLLGISAAAKLGVFVVPDKYVAALADPQVVDVTVLLLSLVADGINWALAQYIKKGRLNNGQALSPIVEK